ncbi:MAG: hypothetical protein HKN98_02710 [Silicimonas sp.]|nr:hypothetical protein [Silicimonas sp.]
MNRSTTILASLGMGLWASLAMAAPPEPVVLAPIEHIDAQLVIVDMDGNEHVYTPDSLEAMGAFRVVTKTPWRPEEAVFEGTTLQVLLRAHGLDGSGAIRVTAENDFQSIVEREVWEDVPILLATRVDGRPHTRRARGPIQFVIPDADYSSSDVAKEGHLVWMAARIEPVR